MRLSIMMILVLVIPFFLTAPISQAQQVPTDLNHQGTYGFHNPVSENDFITGDVNGFYSDSDGIIDKDGITRADILISYYGSNEWLTADTLDLRGSETRKYNIGKLKPGVYGISGLLTYDDGHIKELPVNSFTVEPAHIEYNIVFLTGKVEFIPMGSQNEPFNVTVMFDIGSEHKIVYGYYNNVTDPLIVTYKVLPQYVSVQVRVRDIHGIENGENRIKIDGIYYTTPHIDNLHKDELSTLDAIIELWWVFSIVIVVVALIVLAFLFGFRKRRVEVRSRN